MVFFEDHADPGEDRIGEEGEGFRAILHGLNPERMLFAAEAIGIGRAALARATRYARERVVFGRPIGQNQAIQHPLARNWAELEAANLMTLKAACALRRGKECGAEANAAKYLAAEAGFRACRAGRADAWRHGLRQGISRRALFPRKPDPAHRAGQPAADPQLSGRAGARVAKVILILRLRQAMLRILRRWMPIPAPSPSKRFDASAASTHGASGCCTKGCSAASCRSPRAV